MIMVTMTTGCSTVARNETSPSPQNNNGVRAQQSAPQPMEISSSRDVEVHLEKLATGIAGVKSAHCVLIGNTAVVGINVDSKLDRSRVGTIKYSVAEAFRKDPYGVDALVTADMDLNQRVNEIGEDIRAGRPIRGIAEELSDLIGRIVPQLPRDITPADPEEQEAPQTDKNL
ncbi:YhcN/YlaJ family sporulation lipoprotein [Paenibacillus sp. GCM10023252]|uniref:YhcN/YlaJ family sporulation lipoprotein n=1 Tax=Paenibacillus sp. GCM10023252 TaxID=3252649 RepID=UPI003606E677